MGNAFRSHLLACCVAGVLVSAAASADVTMQEQMSLSGSGMMKMANMSGTTTTVISGDRARTESNMTFESAMMRTFAPGGGNHVEIVRLDQDKIYSLNPKKKTYTETTFAEQRAKMQQAMEQMNKAQASQQQSTSGVDESECEWSDPKSEVKRTGEKSLDRRFPGGARHDHRDAVVPQQEERAGLRFRPGARPMDRAGVRGVQRDAELSARLCGEARPRHRLVARFRGALPVDVRSLQRYLERARRRKWPNSTSRATP